VREFTYIVVYIIFIKRFQYHGHLLNTGFVVMKWRLQLGTDDSDVSAKAILSVVLVASLSVFSFKPVSVEAASVFVTTEESLSF